MFSKKLNERDIKESIDKLPTGIIVSNKSGVILLANELMYELYFELSGKVLQSMHSFWDTINTPNQLIEIIEEGESPTLKFSNGKVYNFNKNTFLLDDEAYFRICAVDISDVYKYQEELVKKNKSLMSIMGRLRASRENLEDVTYEKELIDAKMKIHNNLGSNLAIIKRYLNTGEGDISGALFLLDKTLDILKKTDDLEKKYDFDSFISAVHSTGVKLEINGDLPNDRELIRVIITAARECLINAIVHANASKFIIDISEDDVSYIVSFSNDGTVPKKEIKEGGGFMAIKNATEKIGAYFRVKCDDTFVLSLFLPKLIIESESLL